MLKTKVPSLVILLDFLLMFLFVLLIRQTKEEYFFLLPDQWVEKNIAISFQNNGLREWVNDKRVPPDAYNFSITCDETKQWLQEFANKADCELHFFGRLAEDISILVFQACSAGNCGSLKIPINPLGERLFRSDILNANPNFLGRKFFTFFSG